MIPDRIVWKTLTSHVPNPSHTHINRTRSLRLALRSLFHINKWRRTRAPFPFSYHKHTCSHLHVDATHAFTTYRSIYEPHDTVQNGRFTHTVTHTHTHTHTHIHTHSAERRFDDFKSSSTQTCLLRENVLSTWKSQVQVFLPLKCVYGVCCAVLCVCVSTNLENTHSIIVKKVIHLFVVSVYC